MATDSESAAPSPEVPCLSGLHIGRRLAIGEAMTRCIVYVLRNAEPRPRYYVGITADVAARLADHNEGRCPHTAKHRPWCRHVVIEFSTERNALAFERYLKSGSGRAFAKRHFG